MNADSANLTLITYLRLINTIVRPTRQADTATIVGPRFCVEQCLVPSAAIYNPGTLPNSKLLRSTPLKVLKNDMLPLLSRRLIIPEIIDGIVHGNICLCYT
jgi:hypothetical protein